MITPEEIGNRLSRCYPDYLRAWLRGESLLPLDLPAGKSAAEWSVFKAEVERLLSAGKTDRRPGYRVEMVERQHRWLGKQQTPQRIWVDTDDDFLTVTGKKAEFQRFQQDVALIRTRLPQLEGWLHQHPQRVIEQHGQWPLLLEVCAYFLENPRPGRYLRELPVSAHSKFIEQHTGILRRLLDFLLPDEEIDLSATRFTRRYGLRESPPLVRLRLLDHQLEQRYGLPLTDISIPLTDLNRLPLPGQRGIIVENLTTFLSLPDLPATFTVFGKGFDALQLGQITWLMDTELLYWGDLDAQGLAILAHLRRGLPHVRAVMMDAATFERFAGYAVSGTPAPILDLPELTPHERALYRRLAEENMRLEQERIPYDYALGYLQSE